MKLSKKGKDIIKTFEALRLRAYKPTEDDVWTIGWGHTDGVTYGMTITIAEAERLLEEDLRWVNKALKKLVKVPLTQNQYDALGSFVFNVGETNFISSTLLRKLNQKDYYGASREFDRWVYQKGKLLRGLVIRRELERELFDGR